jgi:hypothetical protein
MAYTFERGRDDDGVREVHSHTLEGVWAGRSCEWWSG